MHSDPPKTHVLIDNPINGYLAGGILGLYNAAPESEMSIDRISRSFQGSFFLTVSNWIRRLEG